MKQLTLNDAEMMFEVIIYMLLEYKFDSQTSVMDHNASNEIIDSQLNLKDNDDNEDDDD